MNVRIYIYIYRDSASVESAIRRPRPHAQEGARSRSPQINGNYHGRLIGKALNGLHSNVLLGQITISKTRTKRVNENIATTCTQQIKSQYMQIFMFVSVSVSIIMHCLYR